MCSICWESVICVAPPPWRARWRPAASTCCWCREARRFRDWLWAARVSISCRPLRAADETLKDLSRLDGTPLDEAFAGKRARELLDLLHAEAPDILITEQFPFGRTRLRFELLPLLEAAKAMRPQPLIVSSVRDVVRRSTSPLRVAESVEIFEKSFDSVLIHADPRLVEFARSFAGWDRIKSRALYTGFVAEHDLSQQSPAIERRLPEGSGDVVVSAGGGAVGAPLLQAALLARPKTALVDRTWRLLVGANMPEAERAALEGCKDAQGKES